MAPEQAVGKGITEAADWYSVGVMLYEALTGDVPHTGHALEILLAKQEREPRAVSEVAPDAPRDLVELCMALLAIDPSARPNGREVARRLGILDAEPARVTPPPRSSSDVFIGREREIGELNASFERAKDHAVVHLIVGESGIGKSELVARFIRSIEDDSSALVLNGRCYERESVPYKAFDGVADGLAQHLVGLPKLQLANLLPQTPDVLVRLFPVFVRIDGVGDAPATQQAAEPQEQRRRAFAALRELLSAVARHRRIVIAIDDLQWADADSLLLLRELLRQPHAPRVLVLATARQVDAPDTMPIDRIVEGLADINVVRTNLGPLSDDESRALAARLAPRLAASVDVARIAREAGGHPMFLAEILRHLDSLGDEATTATLDAALTSRVALLPPDARRLLEIVCIAGAPISLEVASNACRLESTALARAIASLRVARLAREVQRSHGLSLALEPFHDRVRESVAGALSEPQRRDMHARLAMALETAGEQRNPQLLLRHFLLAEQPERAARYAEEAALRSLAAHAFDQAARLWQLALDIKPREADERRQLLLRLGEAHVAAGHAAEAAEVYLAAAEGADRATRLVCHRHVAEQLLISGHIERGVEFLQTLLAEINARAPMTPKRVLVSLIRSRVRLRLRGFRFKERHRSEISDAEILRLEVLQMASKGLSVVDTLRGADFQTRAILLALRSGLRPYIAHTMVLEGMHRAMQGNYKGAYKMLDHAREAFGGEPDDLMHGLLYGGAGLAEYGRGDPAKGLELLANAEAKFRKVPGATWEVSSAKLFWLFNARVLGDFRVIRAHYDQYLIEAQQRGDRYVESTMRRVCVSMWLAEDAPAEAERELARATWGPVTAGFHIQHFHELVGYGEIALYTSKPMDEARFTDSLRRLQDSMLLHLMTIRMQHAYLLGRLAIAGHAPAKEVVKHARVLEKVDTQVSRVWALVLRAGLALRERDQPRSEKLLTATGEAARAAGMKLVSAVARYRLAELRRDDALLQTTSGEMRDLGVRAPAKTAALIIPTGPQKVLA
jgi:tetratricopeptide (TPR) repeat protein